MKNILYLTYRLPFPPVSGEKIRAANFLKYLKRQHNITLVTFINNKKELEVLSQFGEYFDKIITIKLPRYISIIHVIKGFFRKEPLQVSYFSYSKYRNFVKQELESGKYDVIFCHIFRVVQYIPENTKAKKIVDLTDAISLNYQRSIEFSKGIWKIIYRIENKRIYKYELQCIDKSDKSIFISEIDANHLRNERNNNKIEVIRNGVDLQKFTFFGGEISKYMISFIGLMRYFPNIDAVLYFTSNILPLIKQKVPKVKFYIVGGEAPKKVLNLHNGSDIFVTGFLDSVLPYFQQANVFVAPFRSGSGVQNKILESLAIGTPVVTTSIGAEGIDQSKLLIGDTPEYFAELVVKILLDEEYRRELSTNGRNYIEYNFKWENTLQKLEEIL